MVDIEVVNMPSPDVGGSLLILLESKGLQMCGHQVVPFDSGTDIEISCDDSYFIRVISVVR